MRTLISIWLMLVVSIVGYTQSPYAFNYQGVAANGVGELLSNEEIRLRVSIVERSATGPTVYSEIHNVLTDERGHYMITIGRGEVQEGNFASLDWAMEIFWYKIEYEVDGIFEVISTLPVLSVPIANHAISASSGQPGIQGPQGPTGAKGPKGPTSPQGPACPANPQGQAGDPGPTGPQGMQGPIGITGFTPLDIRSTLPSEDYPLKIYLDDGTNRSDGQLGLRYLDDGVWVDIN